MKNWIRSSMFVLSLLGVGLAPLSEADAALKAYLHLQGQKAGEIKGGAQGKGREGAISVIAVSHEIVSPRDAASGLPTGKRSHKPLVITKELDKSSPLLESLLVNNENLKSWVLDVWLPSPSGTNVLAYTVKLTNANIASIRLVTDADGNIREEVAFTYQKIEWTWVDGGIMAEDSWSAAIGTARK